MANPARTKALKRKKTIQKIIGFTSVILLILLGVILYFRRDVQHRVNSRHTTKVETLAVENGSMKITVSGSGALTSEGIVDITLPNGVTADTVYVEPGQDITQGTMLASVNTGSVVAALTDTQSRLDDLDEQLRSAGKDAASTRVSAGVNSRVKAIFAQPGDDVASVMYEHGALALLSLDGKMCVDVEADYEKGAAVTVTCEDGKTYPGTVSAVRGGTATILLTDNGPLYGENVKVDDKYEGTLDIHQSLKVTGYAGTVSYVNTKENASVYSGSVLFTLKDTAYSANYDQLLAQRSEYEQTYQELVTLYLDGAVYAPADGTVRTVQGKEETPAPSTASKSGITSPMGFDFSAFSAFTMPTMNTATTQDTASDDNVVVSLDPNTTMSVTITVDETDILSLAVGQEVCITVESIGEDVYYGKVAEIDTTPASSGGVTHYTAKILLDRAENMLPGMTANLSITIHGVDNAIVIPEEAVHRTSATAYVYTSYDAETDTLGSMVEVTTGLTNGKNTEIVSGLNPGDVIYYTPKVQTFTFGNFTVTSGLGG